MEKREKDFRRTLSKVHDGLRREGFFERVEKEYKRNEEIVMKKGVGSYPIKYEIEELINMFPYRNYKNSEIILLHPETCTSFENELRSFMSNPGVHSSNSRILEYKGLKIYRSYDVERGEIKIY